MTIYSSKSSHPLYLAHLSLLDVPPPTLVRIASEAGFDGMTLRLAPAHPGAGEVPYPMLGAGSQMMKETLACLHDLPVKVLDIETVRITADLAPKSFLPLFEAGQRLGATCLLTYAVETDRTIVAGKLNALAELAAPFGLKVALEFMVYNGVKTVEQAMKVMAIADHPNIVLMVDSLHLARSGGTPSDLLQIDAALMPYIQICDAPAAPLPDDQGGVRIEARAHRLLPGEGDLPLKELIALYPPGLALSVEAPVKSLRALHSPLEIAAMAYRATRKLLEIAG